MSPIDIKENTDKKVDKETDNYAFDLLAIDKLLDSRNNMVAFDR